MDHVSTNIDKSRSPVIIPFLILGMLATIGGLATIFALLHHGSNGTNGTGDAVPVVQGVGPRVCSRTDTARRCACRAAHLSRSGTRRPPTATTERLPPTT